MAVALASWPCGGEHDADEVASGRRGDLLLRSRSNRETKGGDISVGGGGSGVYHFPVSLRGGLLAFLYHHFTERGGHAINMEEWKRGGRR